MMNLCFSLYENKFKKKPLPPPPSFCRRAKCRGENNLLEIPCCPVSWLALPPIAILFFIFGERCGSPSLVKASLEFLLNRIVCERIETFCCFKKSVIFVLLNSMNYTCVIRLSKPHQNTRVTRQWL